MNKPYVKAFDENGVLTNPISGSYKSTSPNRKERRKEMQKDRFFGESKNCHLTVVGGKKYRRVKQQILMKDKKGKYTGDVKIIEHYV